MTKKDLFELGIITTLYRLSNAPIPTIEIVEYDSMFIEFDKITFSSRSSFETIDIEFNISSKELSLSSGRYFLDIDFAEKALLQRLEKIKQEIEKQISCKEQDIAIIIQEIGKITNKPLTK